MPVSRILSGAQTGADRAALDVALALGYPCGGWVPIGRLAEDGRIPETYPNLRETDSPDPAIRTGYNVRDADATLILSHGPLRGGSLYTRDRARHDRKPVLHIDLDAMPMEAHVRAAAAWLADIDPSVLNVAGPRASQDPAIYGATRTLLTRLFACRRSSPRTPHRQTWPDCTTGQSKAEEDTSRRNEVKADPPFLPRPGPK